MGEGCKMACGMTPGTGKEGGDGESGFMGL